MSGKQKHNANPMWGGRFESGPDALMREINASIHVDYALYGEDIAGSIAHARMLEASRIITQQEAADIVRGLEQIRGEIDAGQFTVSEDLEDIHMHIEARLKEIIGDAAGRLHTARSRNDQVATDLRLYVRRACDETDRLLQALQAALLKQAGAHTHTIMPGFTHLQSAQPVTFGHHLLAYAEMFWRDRDRFHETRRRANECPLGAAALAGTSFPIDRHMSAKALGFDHPMRNSLDAVASRDFAVDFLAASTTTSLHLSRLAEEMILWSTPQFSFVRLPEGFTSGSSIMPQKRNPDAAELVRGKSGRILGNLVSLCMVLKGLPLAYNKDLQEDKEPVFDSHYQLELCLRAMTGMADGMQADKERMEQAAGWGHATATDLADWLVRECNLPFRDAHHVTGRIVKLADELGVTLEHLHIGELQRIDGRITPEVLSCLSVAQSVKSRTSYGGTSPENVRNAIMEAKERYGIV